MQPSPLLTGDQLPRPKETPRPGAGTPYPPLPTRQLFSLRVCLFWVFHTNGFHVNYMPVSYVNFCVSLLSLGRLFPKLIRGDARATFLASLSDGLVMWASVPTGTRALSSRPAFRWRLFSRRLPFSSPVTRCKRRQLSVGKRSTEKRDSLAEPAEGTSQNETDAWTDRIPTQQLDPTPLPVT